MQESTLNELVDLSNRTTGLHISPTKAYLLDARLSHIARRESFATLDDLVHCLKARPNQRFEQEVAAALTNKRTCFFREREQMEQIVSHALPKRLEMSNTGRLRIWCAGVSTGQEAWSLAMRLAEEVGSPLASADIEIIGTDISTDCIEIAKTGTYGHFDVQKGLSIHRLMSYFNRLESEDWTVTDQFRDNVFFRRHNLLHPAQDLGAFDVIVCNNVLPDMTKQAQHDVLTNISRQLLPDGYLFVGPEERPEQTLQTFKPSRVIRGAYERDTNPQKIVAA